MANNLEDTVNHMEDATISFDLKDLQGNILKTKDIHMYISK